MKSTQLLAIFFFSIYVIHLFSCSKGEEKYDIRFGKEWKFNILDSSKTKKNDYLKRNKKTTNSGEIDPLKVNLHSIPIYPDSHPAYQLACINAGEKIAGNSVAVLTIDLSLEQCDS